MINDMLSKTNLSDPLYVITPTSNAMHTGWPVLLPRPISL